MGLNLGKVGASLIPGVGPYIAGQDAKEAAKENKKAAQEGARYKLRQTLGQARFDYRTTIERTDLEQSAATEAANIGRDQAVGVANLRQQQAVQGANLTETVAQEGAVFERGQAQRSIGQQVAGLDAKIDGERSLSAIRQTDMARKAAFATGTLRARAIGSGVAFTGTARAVVDQSAILAELDRLNANYESEIGVRGMFFDRSGLMLKSRFADEVADFTIRQAGRAGELTRSQAGSEGDIARYQASQNAEYTVRQQAAGAALTREQSADGLAITNKFAYESKNLELKYAQIGYRTERNRIDTQTAINIAGDLISTASAGIVNYTRATGQPVIT
jgi:hypothetical protein